MGKGEIRGVWLTNTDSSVLNSQENIAQAMEFLAETGFNVVFPVVWNRGVTLYPSGVMHKTFGMSINSMYQNRDPLGELVTQARRVGLKVIPWFEYGFASSYNLHGGLLLEKKPEWKACDRQGNLLKKNGFEWLNALDSQVQDFLLSLVLEVVTNYNVDGIQGDDRFPAFPSEGGYDEITVKRYHQQFGENPPTNPQDKQWLQWRADILTEFLARLYQQVKAVNPHLIVSVAPNIYDWGFKEYLQDSVTWMERGIVDMIHPQVYRRDLFSYKYVIDKLISEQFTNKTLSRLAPGMLIKVGSYNINIDYFIKAIKYNRDYGIPGEVFFFYEGLRANDNALAEVLKKNIYNSPASFPSLTELSQGIVIQSQSISIWQRLWRWGRKLFKFS
ncbi:MAG: family 10 glycosylhydrolase [Calothrix sp. MO_167.B42]|nr:family 10 glycosylhydrolase [Calothrix sp. MO_167.B42]